MRLRRSRGTLRKYPASPNALLESRAINYTAQWRSAECPSDAMYAPPGLPRLEDACFFLPWVFNPRHRTQCMHLRSSRVRRRLRRSRVARLFRALRSSPASGRRLFFSAGGFQPPASRSQGAHTSAGGFRPNASPSSLPNAQRPTPNAQRPTPNAQRPTPNTQRLTPCIQ